MNRAIHVGIVADYDPKNKYHVATEQSVDLLLRRLQRARSVFWRDDGNFSATLLTAHAQSSHDHSLSRCHRDFGSGLVRH